MYSVLVTSSPAAYDDTIAALWEFGTLGIIEESAAICAFFDAKNQANAAAAALNGVVHEATDTGDTQFANNDDWDPVIVGQRFFITPCNSNPPTPVGRVRISVNAQGAFGSGRHESTQLMLEAIETVLEPGMVVADIGCGSGILGSAASLLGAANVFACDIDPNALSVARERPGVQIFAGSADAVCTASVDLVLANISGRVLDLIAPDLHRITKTEGHIAISGFIHEHVPKRFRPEKVLTLGDWQCWICAPDPVLAAERHAGSTHLLRWW